MPRPKTPVSNPAQTESSEEIRVMSPQVAGDEEEQTLRPKNLSEYVGQTALKESLSITLEAAKKRKEALEHLLLAGPPGLGKTTLAAIIAKEMGVNIKTTSGPIIERAGDLAAILTNLQPNDLLF